MAAANTHPLFARFYAWTSPKMERAGLSEFRGRLLAGLHGQVLEVGAGNGLNFGHYPPEVDRLVAIEPEPHLRKLAAQEAAKAAIDIELRDGTAEHIEADDASFDAAVTSLVLCSVPDQQSALTEIRRVLRPGGELRFFEHVRAPTRGLARLQEGLDATVWPKLGAGCHTARDTGWAIAEADFRIESIEHIRFPDTRIAGPTTHHILGIARRPLTGSDARRPTAGSQTG